MEFKTNSGVWGTMFGVPYVVADNFLKLATGEQLKVLLYILRCSGRTVSPEEIAMNTGVSPAQAEEAVMFWQQVNVLSAGATMTSIMSPPADNKTIITETINAQPVNEKQMPAPVQPEQRRKDMNPSEIAAVIKSSTEIAELFKVAESMLGTLNHKMQDSLIWICQQLSMKNEVLLTLLCYCSESSKTDPNYIEKVASDWIERGICDLAAAQEEVERLNRSKTYTGMVMKAFEMKRNPTTKQKEFIDQWQSVGYSMELIRYAYEKTIEKIDKLSFDYINKILLSWNESGFRSLQDVQNSENEYRKKRKNDSSGSDSDFDVEKYKFVINNF